MKATVNLDDRLYRRVKVTAAERGVTVTSIFEAALRRYLDGTASTAASLATPAYVLPVVDGSGGLLPGVDLANGAETTAIMDADYRPEQLR